MAIKTKQYKQGVTVSEHSRLVADSPALSEWQHGDGPKSTMKAARFWVNGHLIATVKQRSKVFYASFDVRHIRGGEEVCAELRKYEFFSSAIDAKRWARKHQAQFADWLIANGANHGYKLKADDIKLWK
jgi:hypothetical protein